MNFIRVADALVAGSRLYPKLAQPVIELAEKLHDKLGPDFPRRARTKFTRAQRVLLAVGMFDDKRKALNFVKNAFDKQNSRDTKARLDKARARSGADPKRRV